MGYGAYLRVTNSTKSAVTTLVNDIDCMYDHKSQGSNPSFFNNLVIQPGQSVPADGPGQYVEAKGSGTCAFVASHFTLQVNGGGSVTFQESGNSYSASSGSGIAVKISNGDQATISVTLS